MILPVFTISSMLNIVPMNASTAIIITEDHRKQPNSKRRYGFGRSSSVYKDCPDGVDGDDHDGGSPETAESETEMWDRYNSTERKISLQLKFQFSYTT